MIWPLELLVLVVLIATAVLALVVRDLLGAVAVLSAYSLFVALLFAIMAAPDVAFVEVVLGAGVSGVLFIGAVLATSRADRSRERGSARWLPGLLVAGFLALMLYGGAGLPAYTDPDAAAHQHVSPTYLERSLADTKTPNVVTAVLADYRSFDTLGETLVIVTAGLACALVMRREDHA
jgi:multicomponent Na+:H+ antiporter subunit B